MIYGEVEFSLVLSASTIYQTTQRPFRIWKVCTSVSNSAPIFQHRPRSVTTGPDSSKSRSLLAVSVEHWLELEPPVTVTESVTRVYGLGEQWETMLQTHQCVRPKWKKLRTEADLKRTGSRLRRSPSLTTAQRKKISRIKA